MAISMWVTLQIFMKISLCIFPSWLIGCEQYCTFSERQCNHSVSYDQQGVSDIAHFMKGSLVTSFPMTNREWATLHILWRQSHHIFSYDQQKVSDIAHFVESSLITSFPMTNSLWVTLPFLWRAVSSHLFLWPTVCEWHCTFYEGSLIKSFSMTNREWVTLHILWKGVSSHLFLWPTGSEWYCTFCERQSHHIFSYDQQPVSGIAHFVKGSLITSFPMINRLWVTLHILWKAVSSHLFLWPTDCEWHCTFC